MLIRRIARPLLAAIFISGGINALRHPKPHAEMADPVAPKIAEELPIDLPSDPETLVKIDAAVKIVAGTMLSINVGPRIAALALAGSLVPTTVAGHPFWEEHDPEKRQQQQINFFKNVGLLGGLMLAAVDTEGKPSVGWRARRAAKSALDSTSAAVSDAASTVKDKLPIG